MFIVRVINRETKDSFENYCSTIEHAMTIAREQAVNSQLVTIVNSFGYVIYKHVKRYAKEDLENE
jgi:hypothetical protein